MKNLTRFSRSMRKVTPSLIFLISFFLTSFAMADAQTLSALDQRKVITIKGHELPSLLGNPIDQYSVEAVKDGVLKPIPFQIDEYNIEHELYFEALKVPIDGQKGIVDNNDELLFFYSDAGSRKTDFMVASGKIISEVKLTNREGVVRYVYVVANSKLSSDVYHVRYSSELGKLETDFFSVTVNPKNALYWDDFQYFSYNGEGDSPLDTMKLRISTGVITSFPRWTFNNKNLIAKPVGENIGPIRATAMFKVTARYFYIPLISAYVQAHYLPNGFEYSCRVKIPPLRRSLLNNATVSLSFDGNRLMGSEIKTALQPELTGVVDGTISEDEKTMIDRGVDEENNWFWLTTKHNFDWLTFLDFTTLNKSGLQFYLVDDEHKKDRPERFDGQLPNIGFSLINLPRAGWFKFKSTIYFSDGFDESISSNAERAREMPEITVTRYDSLNAM